MSNNLDKVQGVIDISASAKANEARKRFIDKWIGFRDETHQLSENINATPQVFAPPLGQWMSLTQVHILRAHKWSTEVLELFEGSPFAQSIPPVKPPQTREPVALTHDGLKKLRQRVSEAINEATTSIDWTFVQGEYELIWATKRIDQVWAAAKEAIHWLDMAIEHIITISKES